MFGAVELARANGNIMTVGLFAGRWDGIGVLKNAFSKEQEAEYRDSAARCEIRAVVSLRISSENPFGPYLLISSWYWMRLGFFYNSVKNITSEQWSGTAEQILSKNTHLTLLLR